LFGQFLLNIQKYVKIQRPQRTLDMS